MAQATRIRGVFGLRIGDWILVTSDKDFGEKIFRDRRPHHEVILLRLADGRSANKIATLQQLLNRYATQLPNNFVVATEQKVRFVHQR